MARRQNNRSDNMQVSKGGGGWLLVLVGWGVAGYFTAPALAAYLTRYAPAGSTPQDMQVGTWTVVIVLVLVLTWCFAPSKGGRR